MLLDARGDDRLHVHFTYPIAEIDVARKKDWERSKARRRSARRKIRR